MDKVIKQLNPKDRILKTVERLFCEQGYLSTGINQIIAEAQVAKASFYQHFSSKEALILEYLENYHKSFGNLLKQLDSQHQDSRTKIEALFDALADSVQKGNFQGCIFLNISAEFSEPESKPRQLIAQCKTGLKEYVENWVLAALPVDTKPEIAQIKATAIYLLIEGALVESRIYHDLWPFESGKAAMRQLLN